MVNGVTGKEIEGLARAFGLVFDGTGDWGGFAIAIVEGATAEERQACAKLCDRADKSAHPADLADAIRARMSSNVI